MSNNFEYDVINIDQNTNTIRVRVYDIVGEVDSTDATHPLAIVYNSPIEECVRGPLAQHGCEYYEDFTHCKTDDEEKPWFIPVDVTVKFATGTPKVLPKNGGGITIPAVD